MAVHPGTREDSAGVATIAGLGAVAERSAKYDRDLAKHRERTTALIERFSEPCPISEVVDLFDDCKPEQRYRKAHRITRKLVKRRTLKVIGVAQLPGKRSQLVYCTRSVKSGQIEHEVAITEMHLALANATELQVARGQSVDPEYRADIEFMIDGVHVLGEYDTGTENHRQVRERWEILAGAPAASRVLWVTRSEERRTNLANLDGPLGDRMLLVTLDQLKYDPAAIVRWVSC